MPEPERIQPATRIESGFVDYGRRPGRGPLDALSDALKEIPRAAQAGIDFAERAAEREVRDNAVLLASPTLTRAEAEEIRNDATFPLARLKAENRMGALRVQEVWSDWEDQLANTADPLEARRKLAELQDKLIKANPNATRGEVDGIRERVSALAEPLLSEASKKRIALRERREAEASDKALTLAIEDGGPEAFVGVLRLQLTEEAVANGDAPEIMERAALILDNHVRSLDNPDESGMSPNLDSAYDEVYETIDLALDVIPASLAEERAPFAKLRDRMEGEQERRRREALSDIDKLTQNQIHAGTLSDIIEFDKANPGDELPPSWSAPTLRAPRPPPPSRRRATRSPS